MHYLLAIARTGLAAVLQYRLRSAATVGCVVAVLLPYLAGLGLAKGVQEQAEDAIRSGADVYVRGEQLGRPTPVPLAAAGVIRDIEGVTGITPRIVARTVLGKNQEEAVLVGLPPEHFPADVSCIDGRLPRPSGLNEFVLGTELARRLKLKVGDIIPPFYHSSGGDRLSKVVGLFRSDVSLWQARLILTTFEAAAAICDQDGLATDLLVSCRPGSQPRVKAMILGLPPLPRQGPGPKTALKATTREDLEALVPRGLLHREGIFNLHFLVAFAVAILTILVTSGFGTPERRREIGILKATGWQTDEVLLRSAVESFLLSLLGAALALLLAFGWLRLFNGYGVASLFLTGVDAAPGFPVPFRLQPVPALLAFVVAAVLVLSGTLYSTWRAAIVPPREAMR